MAWAVQIIAQRSPEPASWGPAPPKVHSDRVCQPISLAYSGRAPKLEICGCGTLERGANPCMTPLAAASRQNAGRSACSRRGSPGTALNISCQKRDEIKAFEIAVI